MRLLTRRQFTGVVAAGLPGAALTRTVHLDARGRVTIGATTASFRDLPRVTGRDNIDEIIRALGAAHVSHIELALTHIEPAPPSTASFSGGSAAYPRRIVLSPDEVAATNATARAALRDWRLTTAPGAFEPVREKIGSAGVTVHACAVACNDSFTDAELDAAFRQITALGVRTLSSPLTLAMARRLASYAERHDVTIAIHNQESGNAAGLIAEADLAAALAISPRFAVKLDVGPITAAGQDAVEAVRRHEARLSHVVVKDRLHRGGPSQPFGEGDTPIAGVLAVLGASARSIPAFAEYDYAGLRTPVEEVAAAVAYLRRLAGQA